MSFADRSAQREQTDGPPQLSHEDASVLHHISSLPAEELSRLLESLPTEDRRSVKQSMEKIADAAGCVVSALKDSLLNSEPAETTRRPREGERQTIRMSRIVVFVKISKFALDLQTRGVSEQQLLEEYARELSPEQIGEIRSSHFAHTYGVEELQRLLPHCELHILHTMKPSEVERLVAGADLAIALGGDDTFKQLARYIDDGFVLAVNSDPARSKGAILPYRIDELQEVLERLEKGDFLLEEWQRLEAVIEQKGSEPRVTPPVLSEIGIFDDKGKFTYRGVWHNGKKVSVKGTGIIIATGAGSKGWYSSAARAVYPLGRNLPRTKQHAEYAAREYYGTLRPRDEIQGVIAPGDKFFVISSSNNTPILNCDYSWDVPFPHGSKATIQFSDKPLKVISRARP